MSKLPKLQKFWILMLRFSQILTLPLSFWGILLSPTRAAQITEAADNWYFWLILVVTVTNAAMYYEHTWGLSALEHDLGLYFALAKQQPYRPLKLRISRKLALALITIGVVPATMLIFATRYEWMLPAFYDRVALPLSLVNLICCVLFVILYAPAKLYLKRHQQEICWYEYRIPWFAEGLMITAYGRCQVRELEQNLAEVQLSNYLFTLGYVRFLHPELDRKARQKMADKLLASIDSL